MAEPGEDVVFTIPLTDRLTTTDNNVNGKLGNYSASYGNISASATVAKTFAYHVPANTTCGTTLQIPFMVTSDNGTANVNVPLQVGAPTTTPSFTENFDGVVCARSAGWMDDDDDRFGDRDVENRDHDHCRFRQLRARSRYFLGR